MRRLSIRRLMAIVGIVGLAMAKAVMVERSIDYHALARVQANAERSNADYANQITGLTGASRLEARYEQMAAYHQALKIKYQLAACCPWLLVEPDPPEPYPPAPVRSVL